MPGKKRKATSTKAPKAKKAKIVPKKKAAKKKKGKLQTRATDEDLDTELNDMIQFAKDGEFDEVFKILDNYPPYVNERPEARMFCTIHQACFWGDLPAVRKLVTTYNADVLLPTKDGQTPAEVAEGEGHTAVAKYLRAQAKKQATKTTAKKKKKGKTTSSGGRDREADRNRITVTRGDGGDEDEDMQLTGTTSITLRLGAGKGILCGAVLIFSGDVPRKAVCISDRKYSNGAVTHSGDTQVAGRSMHVIHINLKKMPKDVDHVYLTLCSCGASNLSGFDRPSVEMTADGEELIRYDLDDAGDAMSTVMAVLERDGKEWTASPVGAVSDKRFCGNYKVAHDLINS